MQPTYILTLSCPDVGGIVAAVSGFLATKGGFILESTQFGDPSTERFFMRVQFRGGTDTPALEALREEFAAGVAQKFRMDWAIHDAGVKPRVILLVSKHLHCVNDLLHRYRTGQLAMEIPAVLSNHPDARGIVEWHGIPFYHLPIPQGDKAAQEMEIRAIIDREAADCVVLARYMQILSPSLSAHLAGRAINIHHSFLPSFKGAKPYQQAYERGVKIIGATAHYVTDALDEGPIIEQEVIRVDHAHSPEELASLGGDIEAQVLTRALRYHLEHRVLLNGSKTVVFK